LRRVAKRQPRQHAVIYGAALGATTLVIQAGANFIFHQIGVAALVGALVGLLQSVPAEEASVAATTGKSRLRATLLTLMLPITAYVSVASYLAAVPVDIMQSPRGIHGLTFGWMMNDKDLTVLARLNPISPIPDFAIGHINTIAAALSQNDSERKALFDLALRHYELSSKLSPYDPVMAYREALIYGVYPGLSNSERYKLSMGALDRSLKVYPAYPASVAAAVQVLTQFGQYDDALARVDNALKRSPPAAIQRLNALRVNVVEARERAKKTPQPNHLP
jgi:hypothetical protein